MKHYVCICCYLSCNSEYIHTDESNCEATDENYFTLGLQKMKKCETIVATWCIVCEVEYLMIDWFVNYIVINICRLNFYLPQNSYWHITRFGRREDSVWKPSLCNTNRKHCIEQFKDDPEPCIVVTTWLLISCIVCCTCTQSTCVLMMPRWW